jgi:predicted nucleotidyltransferase
MAADRPSVSLLRGDTPEWKLWSLVAELASNLDPDSWILIGGQMVDLHLHLEGEVPRRTTTDVDLVADVLTKRGSFRHARPPPEDWDSTPNPRSPASSCIVSVGPLVNSI